MDVVKQIIEERKSVTQQVGRQKFFNKLELEQKLLQTRRQEEKREVEAKTIFEDLCDEDKILVFYKKLLNEWNQELDKMSPEAKKQTVVATFMQCARDLNPLYNLCRKGYLIMTLGKH